ncbi:MAG: glycosyltransferase family A protein, partial [Pyrinomonadaceae bacterium]
MQEQNPQNKYFTKRVGRNVFATRPRISVIIAVDDSVDLVRETLESVIGQKHREHEIIVVNDGSPETAQLERELKTSFENIIYIKQRRAGISAARNTAIENARGDLIAFVNSGHLWQPDFLTTQLVFIERHNYDAVYCDAVLFGTHSAYRRTFMESSPSEGEVNFESLLHGRCNVLTAGALVRRQALLDVGMFQESAEAFAEFALWLRLAQRSGGIGYQQKQLLKYRANADYRLGDDLTRL